MAERLELLLINPGGRARVYQGLRAKLTAVEPHVWIGVLAADVRKHGYSAAGARAS